MFTLHSYCWFLHDSLTFWHISTMHLTRFDMMPNDCCSTWYRSTYISGEKRGLLLLASFLFDNSIVSVRLWVSMIFFLHQIDDKWHVITAGSPQLKTPFWQSSHIIRGSWRVVPFRPQPLMTLFWGANIGNGIEPKDSSDHKYSQSQFLVSNLLCHQLNSASRRFSCEQWMFPQTTETSSAEPTCYTTFTAAAGGRRARGGVITAEENHSLSHSSISEETCKHFQLTEATKTDILIQTMMSSKTNEWILCVNLTEHQQTYSHLWCWTFILALVC